MLVASPAPIPRYFTSSLPSSDFVLWVSREMHSIILAPEVGLMEQRAIPPPTASDWLRSGHLSPFCLVRPKEGFVTTSKSKLTQRAILHEARTQLMSSDGGRAEDTAEYGMETTWVGIRTEQWIKLIRLELPLGFPVPWPRRLLIV